MVVNVLHRNSHSEPTVGLNRPKRNLHQAQEIIYKSLVEIVQKWSAEDVLAEFKHLFVHHVNSFSSDVFSAVYEIIFSNNEKEFLNTLKRSCYILVNNWATRRNHQAIQDLIHIFDDPVLRQRTQSPTLKRLRTWIANFVESSDFQELKLFAARYDIDTKTQGHWKQRYTAFLLAPQYEDAENPVEQREAARALSKQLRERFKFDLAMYVAHSQMTYSSRVRPFQTTNQANRDPDPKVHQNPTVLGDEALRLIKVILARRGKFSHANLANIFIKQTQDSTFQDFKKSLFNYLTFGIESREFVETFKNSLATKMPDIHSHHDDEILSPALLLRTCNRVVEYLTTEDQKEPSPLFVASLSSGNPLPLVTVFLKIILICRHTRPHLEARIARLIQHYETFPEDNCQWIIHFLEVLNITFAIYAENVQYNLIKMKCHDRETYTELPSDIDGYRIFSLQQGARPAKVDPEAFSLDDELIPDSTPDFLDLDAAR